MSQQLRKEGAPLVHTLINIKKTLEKIATDQTTSSNHESTSPYWDQFQDISNDAKLLRELKEGITTRKQSGERKSWR